ncbi:MAG: hypothetical protein KBB71_12130 [Lentimicrobiaceae bacterium]|nr:hypothetical protein [Lentimicrobiaceae bacterium]
MKINKTYREIFKSLSKVEVIEFRRRLRQIRDELKRENNQTDPSKKD